eukprot:CAMPEP_0206002724 /NCGR_PEP_ID=MMETSP1464-20131121/2927_1 /ASSEMBLY_ACC=CAM_ASM_001124 /TAXON_ID=119497 /ORGANISM="Exanthemachrysis gayraliae, Strain RCC1523" /LENGTH=65 /DNA_ID=CAMNT_0053376077 /DNA_START=187 /DNA_END=381 /DNA_ORIENTATION=+
MNHAARKPGRDRESSSWPSQEGCVGAPHVTERASKPPARVAAAHRGPLRALRGARERAAVGEHRR